MGRSSTIVILAALLGFAAAFDAETAEILRKRELSALTQSPFKGPAGPIHRAFTQPVSGANAMNSPAVDSNGILYITENVGNIYCLQGSTGKLLWWYTNTDGSTMAAPVLASYGALFVGTTKGVLAIYTATGEYGWQWGDGLTMPSPSTVIVDPDIDSTNSIFVAGRGTAKIGFISSLNGGNGQLYWASNVTGSTADALVGGGEVITGYPGQYVMGGNVVVTSFDSTKGTKNWSKMLTSVSGLYTQFLFAMDPNNNVYMGWLGAGGAATVQCLVSSSNGAILWTVTTTLSNNAYGILGPTNLFLASQASVSAYNAANGQSAWTSNIGLTALEPPVMAAPGEYLYFIAGGVNSVRLCALDASTGEVVWEFTDPQAHGVFGAPVFDSTGTLYIESWSQAGSTAYALNPQTGRTLWSYRVDSGATIYYDTALVVGPGVLFCGDDTQIIGLSHASASSNGGAIAGGVIGTLLGVALIGGGVYWYKFKRGRSGYASIGFGGSGAASKGAAYSYQSSI